MRLPDFSRYEVFSNGSTVTVCDTKTHAVILPNISQTGLMYGLTDDLGKRHTFTERRIREAFNFCISPLSFKIPRGGNKYTAKTLEFAKDTTNSAKAIESLMSGDIAPIQRALISQRETAIRKTCATLKIRRIIAERYIDIAEESLIERLRQGKFSSVRPIDEMLANETCRLIELSKRQIEYDDTRTTRRSMAVGAGEHPQGD